MSGKTDAPERLRDLPPSAKLVYKTLDYEGSMTRSDLAEETLLPGRTVGYATKKLLDADLIEAEPDPAHPNRSVYSIPDR